MNTLYISSCVRDGGLYRCELMEDGALRLRGVIPADRPMYAVWRDGILYVLEREPDGNSHESALRRFAVCPDGAYRELGTRQSTQGVCAPHLCVKGGAVYAVNYLSGSVCRIPDIVARHRGSSVHPTRQEASHPHFITEAPDGVLLVTDLGLDRIIAYDEALNRIAETALCPGSGPRHLAFTPDGKNVFCANELSSTVCMYRYDGAGRMTLLDERSTLPENYAGGKHGGSNSGRWGTGLCLQSRTRLCCPSAHREGQHDSGGLSSLPWHGAEGFRHHWEQNRLRQRNRRFGDGAGQADGKAAFRAQAAEAALRDSAAMRRKAD